MILSREKISLIIPTLNPIAFDAEFCDHVLPLKDLYPGLEIIVIDSESAPEKIKAHKTQADLFIPIARKNFNHGGTRNQAAKMARGNFLIFMTQDAYPTRPESLLNLFYPMKVRSQIAVSYGRQVPREQAGTIERFTRQYNYPMTSQEKFFSAGNNTLKTFFSSNVFSCYRKEAFFEVGGFPSPVISNEDMVINYKILKKGYSCLYASSATVVHSHNYSILSQFKRYFDIGVSLGEQAETFKNVSGNADGKSLVIKLQTHLWRRRKIFTALKSLGDIFARFSGFRLGLKHHFLPRAVKRKLSMHHFYWN